MLKKILIFSVVLGMGIILTPLSSLAAVDQPSLQAKATLIDDTTNDSSSSNNYDNSLSSDDNSATSNDDNTGDDAISSDATE